jgi:anti-sigma regulatory factor (Ser/Thr protein kinase)
LDTLTVDGIRTFPGVPESVQAVRAWVADCLPGSPAAADAALILSELFTSTIFYWASGHAGGLATVSIAIGRGRARIHVIDQGARLELSRADHSAAAEEPRLGATMTIVRELADEFVAEGPDKCVTFRVAGPARLSLPDEPGESQPEVKQ